MAISTKVKSPSAYSPRSIPVALAHMDTELRITFRHYSNSPLHVHMKMQVRSERHPDTYDFDQVIHDDSPTTVAELIERGLIAMGRAGVDVP